jgi:hypothetical protein
MKQSRANFMAQKVLIPFSFEFRKRPVEWEQVSARVTGWADSPDRPQHLIARVADGKGTKTINLLFSEFLEGERKALLDSLKKARGEAEKEVFAGVDLDVFAPANQVPVVDGELKKHTQPADAWQMRDDFLRMAPGSEDAQAFLSKWGRWHQTRGYVETRELFALQRAVRDALVVSPESWFATGNAFLPKVASTSTAFPHFAMVTDVCREAICIATTVDLLRRVEFKVCARGDCELPFKVVSKHSKQYCSQYCAHLESVRRNRRSKTVKSKTGVSA